MKYVVGKSTPITLADPVREETGVIIPQNWTAGMSVMIAVPIIAATCVRVTADKSKPMPVVEMA
jgi:hypothetical protein